MFLFRLTHLFIPLIITMTVLENFSFFCAALFRKITAPHGFSALIFLRSGIRGKFGVIMKGAVFP